MLFRSCITNSAVLQIAEGGGAKVDLASGVNEVVERLFIGGAPRRAATYGAPGSGAQITSGTYFSGSGILTVLLGYSGTLIQIQ